MQDGRTAVWRDLLIRLGGLYRRVKEPGWDPYDKQTAYDLKDAVMERILREDPPELTVSCFRIPYYMYSMRSKDKAGALMRSDPERRPFEYDPSLIEPCEDDIEIPARATVEIVVECGGMRFSFHQSATCRKTVDRRGEFPSRPRGGRDRKDPRAARIAERMNGERARRKTPDRIPWLR